MTEWCIVPGIKAALPLGEISAQERAERGHKAAEITLKKEKKNKRHYVAISLMGWGLGLAKTKDPAKLLEPLLRVAAGCNEYKYLKAFLPIDAYYLNPASGSKRSYLNMVIDNLPAPIKKLTVEQQVKFVCMALALIHQESKFNPNIRSQMGAKGAMQLMASTVRGMRKLYGSMLGPIGSIWDPENNIKIGLTLLFHLLSDPAKDPDQRKYNEGRMDYAFVAYNFGESGAKGVKTTAYQREVAVKYQLYYKLYSQQIRKALAPIRMVNLFQPTVYPHTKDFGVGIYAPAIQSR